MTSDLCRGWGCHWPLPNGPLQDDVTEIIPTNREYANLHQLVGLTAHRFFLVWWSKDKKSEVTERCGVWGGVYTHLLPTD